MMNIINGILYCIYINVILLNNCIYIFKYGVIERNNIKYEYAIKYIVFLAIIIVLISYFIGYFIF